MDSDLLEDPSNHDPDLDRFESGRAVVRAQLPGLRRSGSYSDAFAQQIIHDRVEGRVRISGRSIPPVNIAMKSTVAEGMAFRQLSDVSSFAAANGFDPEVARAAAQRVDERTDESLIVSPSHETRPVRDEISEYGAAYIREIVDAILSGVERCRLVRARISRFSVRKALANSLGHDGFVESFRLELHIQIETDVVRTSEAWVDWKWTLAPSVGPQSVVRHFQARVDSAAFAPTAIPKRAALLLTPGWGGVWMHEAVGHLLEADTFFEAGSPLRDALGTAVSTDSVDIVDDGTLVPSRASAPYDDEGVERQTTPLIESGLLVGLLTDRQTALNQGLTLTGNGRRPHFGLPPRPRMTNLLLRPGTLIRDDLRGLADPIIVADTIRHAWLDADNDLMHLEIEHGTLLRRGEAVGRVGPLVASASPGQLLQNIMGVADDFSVDLNRGYCLKDGAALPVSIGQPSVLVADLMLEPAET